jgi:uncharacterized protein (DUF2336 family)
MVALTREFVIQFAQELSWTARAKTVERVATRYVEGVYDAAGHAAALDLLRLALNDSEPLVRRVLAESIKHARDLPRDLVCGIAHDIPEVSAPFLTASPLLGDDELMAIALGGASVQRAAIAGRPRLSARVANVLYGHAAVA